MRGAAIREEELREREGDRIERYKGINAHIIVFHQREGTALCWGEGGHHNKTKAEEKKRDEEGKCCIGIQA